jgi:hypothetical protein
MIWTLAYVALVIYAAVAFMVSVARDRPAAALGTLIGMSGFQFLIMDTMHDALAATMLAAGLALVARDVALVVMARMLPRVAMATVRARGAGARE